MTPAADSLTFTDPLTAAQEAITSLRERDVDYVIGLSHLGKDDALAEGTDADAILGGHRHHQRIKHTHGTLLTRPSGNGREVIELEFNDTVDAHSHNVRDAPIHEAVADAYRRKLREAGLDDVVATVDTPIPRTYQSRFHGESRLGNFVADAYRWATGADISIAPGGSLRNGPPLDGEVTIAGLISTVPFDNALTVVKVSGADLLDVFRDAERENLLGGPDCTLVGHVSSGTRRPAT